MTSSFLTTGFTTNNLPSPITPAPSTDLGSLFQLILPVGTVLPFAGNVLPPNFLWCDGTLYNINTYNSLYTVIGTTYGTTDSTNFRVPDLKGRTPFGANNILNRTIVVNAAPVTTGGNQILQSDQLASHTHRSPEGTTGYVAFGPANTRIQTGSNGLQISQTEWTNTGGVNNTLQNDLYPLFTVLNYMIKFS